MERFVTVWELDTTVRNLELGFVAVDVGFGGSNLRALNFSPKKLSPF